MEAAANELRRGLSAHTNVPAGITEDLEEEVVEREEEEQLASEDEAANFLRDVMMDAQASDIASSDQSEEELYDRTVFTNEGHEEYEEPEDNEDEEEDVMFIERQQRINNKNIEYQREAQNNFILGKRKNKKENHQERMCRKRSRRRRAYLRRADPGMLSPSESSEYSEEASSAASEEFNSDMREDNTSNLSTQDREETTSSQEIVEYSDEAPVPSVDFRWNKEKSMEETPSAQKSHYKPVLSSFRTQIEALRTRWDLPDSESDKCWGCSYQETSSNTIYAQMWETLIQMFIAGLKRLAKPVELTKHLYSFFYNKVLQYVEKSLNKRLEALPLDDPRREAAKAPVWTEYGLIMHLLFHTSDPEIEVALNIWRSKTIANVLYDNCLFEQHSISGRLSINRNALKDFERTQKLIMQLYRIDTDKFPGANSQRKFVSHAGALLTPAKRGIRQTTHQFLYKT